MQIPEFWFRLRPRGLHPSQHPSWHTSRRYQNKTQSSSRGCCDHLILEYLKVLKTKTPKASRTLGQKSSNQPVPSQGGDLDPFPCCSPDHGHQEIHVQGKANYICLCQGTRGRPGGLLSRLNSEKRQLLILKRAAYLLKHVRKHFG